MGHRRHMLTLRKLGKQRTGRIGVASGTQKRSSVVIAASSERESVTSRLTGSWNRRAEQSSMIDRTDGYSSSKFEKAHFPIEPPRSMASDTILQCTPTRCTK